MSWFLISFIAYFFNAIANVVDKTLLKKDNLKPIVYAFYIAIFGAVLMLVFLVVDLIFLKINILIPFTTFLLAIAAGAVFTAALIFMFKALEKDEATRITPMIGSLTPVFIFVLAFFLLSENLKFTQILAFVFLILGSLLISLDFHQHGALTWLKKKIGLRQNLALPKIRKTLWLALPSATLFGLSHVLTKMTYAQTNFLNGFIWTRFGSFLAIVFLLIFAANRQLVLADLKKNSQKKNKAQTKSEGLRFLIGQSCGGLGALLIQYAIFLGSVTLVNALQGIQYVFVFIMILILTLFAPKILKEEISKEILFQKILAIFIIFVGLYFIVI